MDPGLLRLMPWLHRIQNIPKHVRPVKNLCILKAELCNYFKKIIFEEHQ